MGEKFGRHYQNLRPKKRGVTEKFLMVTVQNYEIRSSKPWCFQNNPNFFAWLFITVLQVILLLILFVKDFYLLIFFYPKIGLNAHHLQTQMKIIQVIWPWKQSFYFLIGKSCPDSEIMSRLVLYPLLLNLEYIYFSIQKFANSLTKNFTVQI